VRKAKIQRNSYREDLRDVASIRGREADEGGYRRIVETIKKDLGVGLFCRGKEGRSNRKKRRFMVSKGRRSRGIKFVGSTPGKKENRRRSELFHASVRILHGRRGDELLSSGSRKKGSRSKGRGKKETFSPRVSQESQRKRGKPKSKHPFAPGKGRGTGLGRRVEPSQGLIKAEHGGRSAGGGSRSKRKRAIPER